MLNRFEDLIMIGPPDSGKTMLAWRLATIMPPLTLEEAVETTTTLNWSTYLPEKLF